MQSYYGSSLAAKGFEVTECQRELQLSKGIVRTWDGKVFCRGCGQQQEDSFRRAAHVGLPDGVKIAWTGSQQDRQAQRGFEPLANPAEYHFLSLAKAHKGQKRNIALRMAQAEKG